VLWLPLGSEESRMSTCTGCQIAATSAEDSNYPVSCPSCGRTHEPPAIGGPDDADIRVMGLEEQLKVCRAKALTQQSIIDTLKDQAAALRAETHNAEARVAKVQEAHSETLVALDEMQTQRNAFAKTIEALRIEGAALIAERDRARELLASTEARVAGLIRDRDEALKIARDLEAHHANAGSTPVVLVRPLHGRALSFQTTTPLAAREAVSAIEAERDTLRAKVAELEGRLEAHTRNAEAKTNRLNAAESRAQALQAFKNYVHQRLDEAGVPKDPESPHKAAGCRIGGRLDEVFAKLDHFRGQRNRFAERVERLTAAGNELAGHAREAESMYGITGDAVVAEWEDALRRCCERDHDADGNCDRHRAPTTPEKP
jgi:DNA repair exonuclease SbcCD ATPase subunit